MLACVCVNVCMHVGEVSKTSILCLHACHLVCVKACRHGSGRRLVFVCLRVCMCECYVSMRVGMWVRHQRLVFFCACVCVCVNACRHVGEALKASKTRVFLCSCVCV
jgi:hypothetical protein